MANSSLVGILAETTASYVATNLLIVLFMTVYALEFLYSKVGCCHSYTTFFNYSSSTKVKVASPDALAWNSFYYFNTFQLPQIATPPDSPDSTWSLSIFGTLFVHSPIFFIVATLLMIIFALITIIGVTTDVFSKSKYLPHLPVPNVSPRLRRSSVSTSDHDHHDTPVLALPLPFLTLIARVFKTFVIWISLILAVLATVSWMLGGRNVIVLVDGVLGDMQDSCSRLLTSGAIGRHTLHDLSSIATLTSFSLIALCVYYHRRFSVPLNPSLPCTPSTSRSVVSPSSPSLMRLPSTLIARAFRISAICISLILAVIATVSWMFGGVNTIVWIDGVLGDMQDSCSRFLTSCAIGSHTLHDLMSLATLTDFSLTAQHAYQRSRSAVLSRLSYPPTHSASPSILLPSSPVSLKPLYSPTTSEMSVRTLVLGFVLAMICTLCMLVIMFLRGFRFRIDVPDSPQFVETVIVDDVAHEIVEDEVVKLEPEVSISTPVISPVMLPRDVRPLLTASDAGPQDAIPPVIFRRIVPSEGPKRGRTMKRGWYLVAPATRAQARAWERLEDAHDNFIREQARAEALQEERAARARALARREARAEARRKAEAEARKAEAEERRLEDARHEAFLQHIANLEARAAERKANILRDYEEIKATLFTPRSS